MRKVPNICTAGIAAVFAIGIANSVAAHAQSVTPGTAGTDGLQARPVESVTKSGVESAAVPASALTSMDALRRLEPDVDEEYTLGAGDELAIAFPGRPELSTKSSIGPDGRITLPLAGPMVIVNLTRDAAATKIAAALSTYYTHMTATVDVLRYGSNHVSLLGNVKTPGVMFFDQTPTLLEVLSRGGVETRPDGSLPDQCVIYRGDQVYWIDLQELLRSGSPLANLRLRRNDSIFVPGAAKIVTLLGQVQHPGPVPLRRDSTLTTLLGDAGGLTDAAGGNPEIQVVHRTAGGKTQYVHLNDLWAHETEVELLQGDVVIVPKSGLSKVGFVMQQVSPFVYLGSLAAVALH